MTEINEKIEKYLNEDMEDKANMKKILKDLDKKRKELEKALSADKYENFIEILASIRDNLIDKIT